MGKLYQLLPPLRDEEHRALEADIAKRGVKVAVEKDDDGNILDGHNRVEIAERLGLPYEVEVRRFDTETEKREHILKLNLCRRHLDGWRWGEAFKLLLAERGVRRGKGRQRKVNEEKTDTVSVLAEELGIDERTARRRMVEADAKEELPEEAQAEVERGETTVKAAVKEQAQDARDEHKKQRARAEAKAKREVAASGKQPWEIICGDVKTELPRRADGSARLIFADPPYNIGVDYGEGPQADKQPEEDYLAWTEEWLQECQRILAPDGTCWVMICDEWAAQIGCILQRVGFHRRAWIKWYETFGVNCTNTFNRCSRHLFYCVKNPKKFTFNPEAVTRLSDRQEKYGDKRANPEGKLWDDVWVIPRLVGTAKERLPGFPTQVPLQIMQQIVGCASNPKDCVFDPFSGSATTGVAAITTGRLYVGVEKNKEYCRLSKKRLAAS